MCSGCYPCVQRYRHSGIPLLNKTDSAIISGILHQFTYVFQRLGGGGLSRYFVYIVFRLLLSYGFYFVWLVFRFVYLYCFVLYLCVCASFIFDTCAVKLAH